MNQGPFKEYIRETEPDKRDKGYAWRTAIGLQATLEYDLSEEKNVPAESFSERESSAS